MAREFKLFSVLWLVAACIAVSGTAATPDLPPTTVQNSTTTPNATTTVQTTTTTPNATTTVQNSTTTPNATTTVQNSTTTPNATTTVQATTTTPDLTTTTLPDPCEANPCGDGSTCEPRANQTVVCLCLAGDFYNDISKSCVNAKVFPGQLYIPGITYKKEMSVKTSPEFQTASQNIIDELSNVFGTSDGYSGSTVLELTPIINSKVWSRSENGVNATVEIAFTPNTDIKADDIMQEIVNVSECEDCLLANASFKDGDLCKKKPCDDSTTKCSAKDGSYNCACQENYIKTDFSSRICIACPSGQKAEGSVCVNCPFGYSGFNCNESWQLVLVIVGSVLGGLLLITFILLPIVACKCSKKSSKENKNVDIGKPYVSHSFVKAPLVNHSLAKSKAALDNESANGLGAFAIAGVPAIPRVTSTNSRDNRTNLEMTPTNSQQNLVPVGRNSRFYESQDDMNPYSQARPQNNPYAQNRPQINPYGSSQGQTNPYYVHDDGRRFN